MLVKPLGLTDKWARGSADNKDYGNFRITMRVSGWGLGLIAKRGHISGRCQVITINPAGDNGAYCRIEVLAQRLS